MAKEKIAFETFLENVPTIHQPFVLQVNELMQSNNCKTEIKEAKNGYVLSYRYGENQYTVMNFLFRKQGPAIRIYADCHAQYPDLLERMPEKIQAVVEKSGPCKRLIDPTACSPTCKKGFVFIMNGQQQIKCRNSCFQVFLSDDVNPFLFEMLEREMTLRHQTFLQTS